MTLGKNQLITILAFVILLKALALQLYENLSRKMFEVIFRELLKDFPSIGFEMTGLIK